MSNKNHELQYKYPPDFEKCDLHRLATRIFKGSKQDDLGEECECCERRVGIKDYQDEMCCYDNMKLAYIGPGIPLLFEFIKNSIVLLLVLALVFMAFALYSNIKGGNCNTEGMCTDAFDTLAIVNKVSEQSYLSIQNYTLLAFVVVSVVVFQYFRYRFRKLEDECDDLITSPSDYAMILRRLPTQTQKSDIENMIQQRRLSLTPEQIAKTENLRVINIVMSFSMTEYKKIRDQNKEDFLKLLDEDKHLEFKPKELPPLEKTASIAIVIFARQESKFLFRYKPNICQKLLQCIWTPCIPRSHYTVKGERISVERAPEPDDIVWENSKVSMEGAICRKTLYSIFSILLLLMGGGIQFGLSVAQLKVSQDSRTQLIMSTASSIAVSVINAVIQIFLVFTSDKERNETLTEFNTVLMIKISSFQFLNTGIFVVLANFLADPQHFSLSKGFSFQVTQVMIMNAVIPNFTLFLLTYCELVPKVKRWLLKRGTIKNSQSDANSVYQGPSMQLPYKYAYVFKTIWLTAFYAPICPIVVPISMAGLLINYWIEKCLFSRVYSIPNTTSSMVNDSAIQLMEYFVLIIALGEFIVFLYFSSFRPELLPVNWSIPIYISIAISGLNLLLPMDSLNNKLFKMPSDSFVYPSYEKVEDKFQVTYEMTNPGYISNRKRKRDLFVLTTLFGNQQIEMTGLNLLPGPNLIGEKRSDSRVGLLAEQDQTNLDKTNPFANLFSAGPPNGSTHSPSLHQQNLMPIGANEIKPVFPGKSLGNDPNFMNINNQNPIMASFSQPLAQSIAGHELHQNSPQDLIKPSSIAINQITSQNNQMTPSSNLLQQNAHCQSMNEPDKHSGNKPEPQAPQTGNSATTKLNKSVAPQANPTPNNPFTPQRNAFPGQTMQTRFYQTIPEELISRRAMQLAPESDRSNSSTRQMRKMFKMPAEALNSFSQFE